MNAGEREMWEMCVFITAVPSTKLFARVCVCVFITAGPSTKLFAWGVVCVCVCVYYCSTYYKAVRGETMEDMCIATRDHELRPVCTSLPITH